MSSPDDRQRDQCANELEELLEGNQDLAYKGTPSTAERAILHARIVATFMDEARGTRRDGRAAVVMAGVPGAGKTASLQDRADLDGYFTLDADQIKTRLLDYPPTREHFGRALSTTLSDSRPVKPAELAGLVHHESTRIYDLLMTEVLSKGYNVILDGTLRWEKQGQHLTNALVKADYERVELVAVKVPQDVAQSQALTRWWTGRNDPTMPSGGRFTSKHVIEQMYPASSRQSICIVRAVDTFNLPTMRHFGRAWLTIHNRHQIGPQQVHFERNYGKHIGDAPESPTVLGH